VGFTWHPGTQEEAGYVQVTFTAKSPGVTVVELVHTGWERRPAPMQGRTTTQGGTSSLAGMPGGLLIDDVAPGLAPPRPARAPD
jgi:hypothetical protein